jgi:hypothetical protein
MRILTHGLAVDAVDEHVQIGESTSRIEDAEAILHVFHVVRQNLLQKDQLMHH